MENTQVRIKPNREAELRKIQKDFVKKFKGEAPSLAYLVDLVLAQGTPQLRKNLNLE